MGRSSANCSTNSFRSCCPAFCPSGSVTFSVPFLPFRSTTNPLFITMWRFGGITEPSRCAWDGRYLSPPRAQAIASRTEVFPWLLFPPMIVRPLAVGSILTAFTRLTFSISNLLIFIDILIFLQSSSILRLNIFIVSGLVQLPLTGPFFIAPAPVIPVPLPAPGLTSTPGTGICFS